jgi:hypothetical protein
MNKLFPVILPALLIVATGFFFLRNREERDKPQRPTVQLVSSVPDKLIPENSKQHATNLQQQRLLQLRQERVERSKNPVLREFAETSTPARREKEIAVFMKAKEPRYRELFNEWKLTEDQIQLVLNILQERDMGFHEEAIRRMKEGTFDVSRDRSKMEASTLQAKRKWESAEVAAEMKLVPILGPDKFNTLKSLEDNIKKMMLSKAQSERNH